LPELVENSPTINLLKTKNIVRYCTKYSKWNNRYLQIILGSSWSWSYGSWIYNYQCFPRCFYFYRTFGLVIETNLPDQTNFYQTEKNWQSKIHCTYKMLIILCLWYLIS